VTKQKAHKHSCFHFDIEKNNGCSKRRTAQPERYFMSFPKFYPVYQSSLLDRKRKQHGEKLRRKEIKVRRARRNRIRKIFRKKSTENGRGRKMNMFKVKDTIK
jgi:hypothetical protein